MKKILILLSTAMLIALATLPSGCSKMEQERLDSNIMTFAPQHFVTKASSTTFESGDVIGVYVTQYNGEISVPLQVSGNYANNSAVTFNGIKWTTQPAIYWADGKFDIYAYYPYLKPTSVDAYQFSVALNQSTAETSEALSGYEASDFLWTNKTAVIKVDAVPLVFKHIMSKLMINLVKGEGYTGDLPSDAVVRIHNTVPTSYIDLASGVVTKISYESPKSITAKKVSTGVYAAIIVPQRLETRLPFIEILSSGVSYLIESTFVFKPGTQHTINITLSNNPEKVKIIIGGEIEGGWS